MFDKKSFSDAIIKIQGERSLNAYGRDSGVSAAYISRLRRGMVAKAPSPEILYKLADRFVQDASYGDLMTLAGHILPFEENEKMRAKKFYLMRLDPYYSALNPDLEEKYNLLTQEERDELDQFVEQSTEEELRDFIIELTNIDDFVRLTEGAIEIDPDIRTLNRAAKDMTPEQRKRAIKILEATFDDLFEED